MSTYSPIGASQETTQDEDRTFAISRRLPTFAELRERLFGNDEVPAVDDPAGLLAADGRSLDARFMPVQEALRDLAFELLPATEGDAAPIWTVASARQGDGATTIAAILAAVVAEDLTRPVLLLEGGLRRPTLATLLGVPETPGLSDVLGADATMLDALHETALHGLWLLPAGTATEQPLRLLRNPVIADLLDAARGRFATVVIDAPAALESSEASLLASWADRTLLVVAGGRTSLADARRAVDALGTERAPGIVLNTVESAIPPWLRRLLGDDGLG